MVDEKIDIQEEEDDEPLFRQEVLEHKKAKFLGEVSIISPLSYSLWALGGAVIALLLGLFLVFGEYSKHYRARGVLLPNKGLILVYPQNAGVVVKRYVKQGEKVTKNQALYSISTEVHDGSKLSLAKQQLQTLEQQLELAKQRKASAKVQFEKYKKLLEGHYVSQFEYQHVYDFYMEREIEERNVQQHVISARSALEYLVLAPGDGIVSNAVAVEGDRVTMEKALCTLIPEGSELEGVMFIHPREIGFVKTGQKILLKYDAFPYQNFGLYEGKVSSIAESALSPKEYDFPVIPDPSMPYIEPCYRVIVELKEKQVNVYGHKQPLTVGVTFAGEIIGERRKIWQWLLEPIYTLRGSLVSHE